MALPRSRIGEADDKHSPLSASSGRPLSKARQFFAMSRGRSVDNIHHLAHLSQSVLEGLDNTTPPASAPASPVSTPPVSLSPGIIYVYTNQYNIHILLYITSACAALLLVHYRSTFTAGLDLSRHHRRWSALGRFSHDELPTLRHKKGSASGMA